MFELLIVIVAFVGMEFAAWATHKYLMHGPLWFLHEDHHVLTGKPLQKNDLFLEVFIKMIFYFSQDWVFCFMVLHTFLYMIFSFTAESKFLPNLKAPICELCFTNTGSIMRTRGKKMVNFLECFL